MVDECKVDPLTGKEKCCHLNEDGSITCTETKGRKWITGSWITVVMISVVLLLLIPFSATLSLDITREFGMDYIVFDTIFLASYVVVLFIKKKWFPMAVAAAFTVAIYVIDGIVWWFLGIREITPPDLWVKVLHDLMMTISYGIVAFTWLVMALRGDRDILYWTFFLFGGWLLVAFASQLIPLWDMNVFTVRHMQTTHLITIVVAVVGYAILAFLQVSPRDILKTFASACALGFFMEFALWTSGIRPSGLDLVFYDTLVLINQGAPFIYIILAKIVPGASKVPKIIGITVPKEFSGI